MNPTFSTIIYFFAHAAGESSFATSSRPSTLHQVTQHAYSFVQRAFCTETISVFMRVAQAQKYDEQCDPFYINPGECLNIRRAQKRLEPHTVTPTVGVSVPPHITPTSGLPWSCTLDVVQDIYYQPDPPVEYYPSDITSCNTRALGLYGAWPPEKVTSRKTSTLKQYLRSVYSGESEERWCWFTGSSGSTFPGAPNRANSTTTLENSPVVTQPALDLFHPSITDKYKHHGVVQIKIIKTQQQVAPVCSQATRFFCPTMHTWRITVFETVYVAGAIQSDPPSADSQRALVDLGSSEAPGTASAVIPEQEPTLLPGGSLEIAPPSRSEVQLLPEQTSDELESNGNALPVLSEQIDPVDLLLTLPDGQILHPGSSLTYHGHRIYFSTSGTAITVDDVTISSFYPIDITSLHGTQGGDSTSWVIPLPSGEYAILAPAALLEGHQVHFAPKATAVVIDGSRTVSLGSPVSSIPNSSIFHAAPGNADSIAPTTASQSGIVLLRNGKTVIVAGSTFATATGGVELFQGAAARNADLVMSHTVLVVLMVLGALCMVVG